MGCVRQKSLEHVPRLGQGPDLGRLDPEYHGQAAQEAAQKGHVGGGRVAAQHGQQDLVNLLSDGG